MKLFKRNAREKKLGESALTLRLWEFTGSAILSLVVFILLAAYLLPLSYMFVTSVKGPAQMANQASYPLYPSVNPQYNYQGVDYPLMKVPTADGVKEWAIVTKRRTYSEFIDPHNPGAGLIHWDGNWYKLEKVYRFSVTLQAFGDLLKAARISQAMTNTLIVALISEIGVLLSSIAVAYGFSRFRIPGGKWLFFVLISTILIPETITLIPTYIAFKKLILWLPTLPFLQFPFSVPWPWLPLILPHFFSSAIFVFLLRQNFRSIPRDLDEAAMLDGAGPLRILTLVILPQSIPVVTTVALLHFFYIWNELRHASLYVGLTPGQQQVSSILQNAPVLPGVSTDAVLQASALLVMIVPIVVLFAFQRFFMQDMIVTGLEK